MSHHQVLQLTLRNYGECSDWMLGFRKLWGSPAANQILRHSNPIFSTKSIIISINAHKNQRELKVSGRPSYLGNLPATVSAAFQRVFISRAVADPGFPRGGGANPRGGASTYYLVNFS